MRMRTVDLLYAHAYHMRLLSSPVMNVLTVVMILCKCQIQMMTMKVTNNGFAMLCQHIYNFCTIAISKSKRLICCCVT